ncbi:unnamed protein product [Caenorhabditis auriculariae]|uniref:Nucleoporin SEH1 n=1 Tax=Caenorhabditis auriculariae TaxID=2777116 RepID=A0A8S1GR25_9PELO|nr:unnamed protein product [Caenorhabditis auriculariae]
MREEAEKPFQAPPTHKDLIHHVSFDHHGRRLATCSSDMTLAIWDRNVDGEWKRSALWKVHGGAVWRVIWAHPEFGQVIATCSFDRNVNVWSEQVIRSDLSRKEKGKRRTNWVRRTNLSDSRANVTDIAFAPRHLGLMLASVSAQGTVRVYEAPDVMDLSKWSLIHELQAFYTRCGCVTWSHSRIHRPLIAVGSDEKKSENNERIVVYEYIDALRKWQRVVALKLDLPSPVTDLKFSPISLVEAHQLAIAAGDVHIFSIKVSRAAILDDDNNEGDEPPVTSTDYSANKIALLGDVRKAWRLKYNVTGTVLTASSCDGTVRTWKSTFLKQWVLLSEMPAEDYVTDEEAVTATTSRGFLSERLREEKFPVYY